MKKNTLQILGLLLAIFVFSNTAHAYTKLVPVEVKRGYGLIKLSKEVSNRYGCKINWKEVWQLNVKEGTMNSDNPNLLIQGSKLLFPIEVPDQVEVIKQIASPDKIVVNKEDTQSTFQLNPIYFKIVSICCFFAAFIGILLLIIYETWKKAGVITYIQSCSIRESLSKTAACIFAAMIAPLTAFECCSLFRTECGLPVTISTEEVLDMVSRQQNVTLIFDNHNFYIKHNAHLKGKDAKQVEIAFINAFNGLFESSDSAQM